MPDDQAFFAKLEEEGVEAVRLKRARKAYNVKKAALVDHWLAMKEASAKPKQSQERWYAPVARGVAVGVATKASLLILGLVALYLVGSCIPSRYLSHNPLGRLLTDSQAKQASLPPNIK